MQKTLEICESNDDIVIRNTRYEVSLEETKYMIYGHDIYKPDDRTLHVYNEKDECILDYFDNGCRQLINIRTNDTKLVDKIIKEFNLKITNKK